mmetsp:Transcript_10254/g.62701  ORF Transcript_10254/g.62701 Transcript_10254/m.62701 type:complete len:216 (-) Transcript_10254:881-1528(-)
MRSTETMLQEIEGSKHPRGRGSCEHLDVAVLRMMDVCWRTPQCEVVRPQHGTNRNAYHLITNHLNTCSSRPHDQARGSSHEDETRQGCEQCELRKPKCIAEESGHQHQCSVDQVTSFGMKVGLRMEQHHRSLPKACQQPMNSRFVFHLSKTNAKGTTSQPEYSREGMLLILHPIHRRPWIIRVKQEVQDTAFVPNCDLEDVKCSQEHHHEPFPKL